MINKQTGAVYGYHKRQELIDLCIKAIQAGITVGTDGVFYSYIGENGMYISQDPVLPECDTYMRESVMRRKLDTYYRDNKQARDMDYEWLNGVIHSLSTVSTS